MELGVCRRKNPPPTGGGNDGRCRRERLTEAGDSPGREPRRRSEREETLHSKRTGTDVLSDTEQRERAPNGLKLSDGPGRRKEESRASKGRSLERVVRRDRAPRADVEDEPG